MCMFLLKGSDWGGAVDICFGPKAPASKESDSALMRCLRNGGVIHVMLSDDSGPRFSKTRDPQRSIR